MKIFMLLFLLFCPFSFLYADTKTTPIESADIFLPIPKNELGLDHYSQKLTSHKHKSSFFEMAVSSWSPSQFARPTYNNGITSFNTGSYPFISLNRMVPFFISESELALYSKFGLTSSHLVRIIRTEHGSKPYDLRESKESMTLLSLRFGLEMKGSYFAHRLLQPYAGVSILPTLALASQSELEGEVSEFGWPVEVVAGVEIYPSFLRADFLGFKKGSVGFGGHYILGSVGGSKMDDLAAQVFFRVEL